MSMIGHEAQCPGCGAENSDVVDCGSADSQIVTPAQTWYRHRCCFECNTHWNTFWHDRVGLVARTEIHLGNPDLNGPDSMVIIPLSSDHHGRLCEHITIRFFNNGDCRGIEVADSIEDGGDVRLRAAIDGLTSFLGYYLGNLAGDGPETIAPEGWLARSIRETVDRLVEQYSP